MSDCIFCKIANHEIEGDYVYEDDLVCAFKDLNPQADVHVLVVPKGHYANIADGVPDEVAGALMHAVGEVAQKMGVAKTGYRVIANTGEGAGQTVFHLHLHVLAGSKLGEGLLPA